MAEYIEREKAIKAIVEAVDNGLATTAEDLEEILRNLPAAEVKHVRHGRWVKPELGFAECSLCGGVQEIDYAPDNYCPKCGAGMDEEAE